LSSTIFLESPSAGRSGSFIRVKIPFYDQPDNGAPSQE